MSRAALSLLASLLCQTHADQACQGSEYPIKVSSLMQSNKRSLASSPNAEKASLAHAAASKREQIRSLHRQTEGHYADLSDVLAGRKTLPGTLASLVEAIKNHSADVRTKLVDEHAVQSDDLDDKYAAVAACDQSLSADVAVVEGSDSSSPMSVAAAAKVTLCECRRDQAKATADSTGCSDGLACYEAVKNEKTAAKDAFLVDTSGATKDMYEANSADMCANSGDWMTMGGDTNDAKALAWFEKQKGVFQEHWDGKTSDLNALIAAEAAATAAYNDAQSACDAVDSSRDAQVDNCTALQNRATMDQCHYVVEKKGACDQYTVCRDDAEAAWTAATDRETEDSEDRKSAWVASLKIECIIDTISQDENGDLQIDASISCENITCDSGCIDALDLSSSLTSTWSSRAACTLPAEPCASGGWDPTCDAAETASWGTYTPAYLIGTRTAPDCSGTPVAVNLVPLQAVDACANCSEVI